MNRRRYFSALAAALLLLVAGFFAYNVVREALLDDAARAAPTTGIETVLARRCVSIVVLMAIGVWMGAIATSPVFVMSHRASARTLADRKFEEALTRLSEDADPDRIWEGNAEVPERNGGRVSRRVLRARRSAAPRRPNGPSRGGLGSPRNPDEGISSGPDNPFRI